MKPLTIGKTRARCKDDLCVLEFDRATDARMREVSKRLEVEGYKPEVAATAPEGPSEFASEIRFKRLK